MLGFHLRAGFIFLCGPALLFNSVLLAQDPALIYPWVSNNAQFESLLVVNNLGNAPTTVRLTARRAVGEEESVERVIPAAAFFSAKSSELFPLLGEGAGYSVTVAGDGAPLAGRWISFQRMTASANSPAQGVAVDLGEIDAGTRARLGRAILFGYLPVEDNFFAAPVIVNLGANPTDVHLYLYDPEGNPLAENHELITGLEPYRPFAVLVEEILPGYRGGLNLIAVSEGNPLSGCSFVFNTSGEPSIGNVSGLDTDAGIQTFSFAFEAGDQGFSGGFADYPAGEEAFYELAFGHEPLPAPLAGLGAALFLNGNNHSADLFMFVKRKVGGLRPNTDYRVRFRIEIASNGAADCSGIGGSPGDSVYFKAGASTFEPFAVEEDGRFSMNIDKGQQSQGGRAMDSLGDIAVETDCEQPEYMLKSFDNSQNLFEIKTDPSGEVWIIAGTDSGFEATTRLYFTRIDAAFFPVGGPFQ